MNFIGTIAAILIVSYLITPLWIAWGTIKNGDSTDLFEPGKERPEKRSGFAIVTDYGTGVQYLAMPLVGLTPRLDKDGKPMLAEGYE